MRRRRRARVGQERRKSKNRRPILKMLCAALLRSFRGQHSEKMNGECPGKLGPSGRPTAISTQPKRGRGPHHHVEAAVDWCSDPVVVEMFALRTDYHSGLCIHI